MSQFNNLQEIVHERVLRRRLAQDRLINYAIGPTQMGRLTTREPNLRGPGGQVGWDIETGRNLTTPIGDPVNVEYFDPIAGDFQAFLNRFFIADELKVSEGL